jgi:hypothetical protein
LPALGEAGRNEAAQLSQFDEVIGIVNEVLMIQHTDDIDMLTDADRFREIAGLLAAGILRLRCRAALLSAPAITLGPENLPKNSLNDLELSRETRLSGHTG